MDAPTGLEPAYAVLQTAASPFRHRALVVVLRTLRKPGNQLQMSCWPVPIFRQQFNTLAVDRLYAASIRVSLKSPNGWNRTTVTGIQDPPSAIDLHSEE